MTREHNKARIGRVRRRLLTIGCVAFALSVIAGCIYLVSGLRSAYRQIMEHETNLHACYIVTDLTIRYWQEHHAYPTDSKCFDGYASEFGTLRWPTDRERILAAVEPNYSLDVTSACQEPMDSFHPLVVKGTVAADHDEFCRVNIRSALCGGGK